MQEKVALFLFECYAFEKMGYDCVLNTNLILVGNKSHKIRNLWCNKPY